MCPITPDAVLDMIAAAGLIPGGHGSHTGLGFDVGRVDICHCFRQVALRGDVRRTQACAGRLAVVPSRALMHVTGSVNRQPCRRCRAAGWRGGCGRLRPDMTGGMRCSPGQMGRTYRWPDRH